MDRVVLEGMASAFERDYAGATYPWTRHPDEVADWADELLALPRDTPSDEWRQWIFAHDDGRRWIGYRVGAYMTDRVVAATGRSVVDLASLGTDDFVQMFIDARDSR